MILVTGATGHIGNVLVRQLLESGKNVRVLLLPGEDQSPVADLDVEKIQGDVLQPKSLEKACRGASLVYHLAGMISIMPGKNKTVKRVNIEGTRNILAACRQTGVKRLVYTSSIHALGRPQSGIKIDETIPFDPKHAISAYDYSKAQASLDVLNACRQGLNAVLICPTGVIGPWDFRLSELGSIIHGAVKGKTQLYVDGAYDFVDVRDVAQGLQQAAEKGTTAQTYILSGERITVFELIRNLWNLTGQRFRYLRIPNAVAQLSSYFMPLYYKLSKEKPRFTPYSLATLASNSDISHAKASREIGYQPRSLMETLRDTVDWFEGRLHLGA